MYKHLPTAAMPTAESLKTTVDRVLPYWFDTIAPQVLDNKNVIVVAHGNSLRAMIKVLRGMSEEEILNYNVPTGVPLVFEFDNNLQPIRDYYLMDEDELKER